MFISILLILITGYTVSSIFVKMRFPKLIGYLVSGIILGPYVLNLINPNILNYSIHLRELSLILILIKAGLSLNIKDIIKIGTPAILLSFLPALFEILGYTLLTPIFFDISTLDAILLGSVMSAVSPAVIVPRMIVLIDNKLGTTKNIPQMILAGASLDDVFSIIIFTSLLTTSLTNKFNMISFLNIPISIINGCIIGVLIGLLLNKIMKNFKNNFILSLLIILISCIIVYIVEKNSLATFIPSLLIIIIMNMVLNHKSDTTNISYYFSKYWIIGELVLFILLGSSIDINYVMFAGLNAVILIFLTLSFRIVGIMISLIGTNLNKKEKLFCIISYMPKATVQAAIGTVPLMNGIASGQLILSISVIAILITAPLGAWLIDVSKEYLLKY